MEPKSTPSHQSHFRVVVAADGSPVSENAIRFSIKLCLQMGTPYALQIAHVTGLNPQNESFMSSLDRTNNAEIQKDAQRNIERIKKFMAEYNQLIKYDLSTLEAEDSVEHIIEAYINRDPPDLLVMGSSNREGLPKLILGSVSDYCLHHCKCPVTIVKP